jgi:hypothetical protein
MVGQDFNDPALAHAAVAAFVHHPLQLGPKGSELFDAPVHLG